MSRRIPNEVIEAVLKSHDIVEVVGKYVHLTKQGHYMKGLCPFHSEKTPSFTVTPEKQIFYCYGCHAGGNAIHFIMEMEGYTFAEAVRQMAQEAAIPVDWEPQEEQQTEQQLERATLYQAYELSSKWYHYILLNTEQGKPALEYLRSRGINDRIIDTFQIGYAPPMWDKLAQFLEKRQFALPLMEKGGLLSKRSEGAGYIDKFRDRIMFPIYDYRGRIIAFGGRAMGDVQPKYMNSPETALFNKSRHLYNIHQAKAAIRKNRSVVLLEGYVDVIKAWESGVFNGVASMGTALTPEHAAMLRRDADEAVLCYDGDVAGQAAAFKSIGLLEKEGFHVKVAVISNGMDPDEFISAYGGERFQKEIIDNALPSLKYKLLYIRKNFNLQDVDGRLRYLETSLRMVAELVSPVDREHYVKDLSGEFQYSVDTMKQQMNEYRQDFLKKRQMGDNPGHTWNNVMNSGKLPDRTPSLKPAYHNAEVMLLSVMMHDRDTAEYVRSQLGEDFNDDTHAALAAYLYAYYADNNESDISRYLATLQDEKLERRASFISMIDPNHAINIQVIDDYIREIRKQGQLKLLEEKKRLASQTPDPIEAAQMYQEIITLENQLKSL